MKAFIISVVKDGISSHGARRCINTIEKTNSHLEPFIFQGTTPDTLDDHWKAYLPDIRWTYPDPGSTRHDLLTGMTLSGYPTKDMRKRKACLVSHVRLWNLCIELNQSILILEHDAAFTRQFIFEDIKDRFTGCILGINSPLKATRKANVFHHEVLKNHAPGDSFSIVDTPWIDDISIPQGLAGNSAYIIKPHGAKALLNRMKDLGAWPNDALMCKQQFPWLQVVYPYYTEVQGLKSTTSS